VSSAMSVTLAPAAAVSAGAQWRVDGGAWRSSGSVATGLTAGAHTVSFSAVSGWIAPSDVATATTNGTTNAFTATYVEESSGPVTLVDEPFDNANITPPDNWEFSGTTWYTSAAYCGASPPAVKFDTDGDTLVTPSFIGGTNLSFVIRGNTTSVTGTLVIAQYITGAWSTLAEITEWSTSKTTNSYAMSQSASKLSFTWMMTNGYVAFDDVKVVGVEIEAALDTDSDGMPDDYESTYFGGATSGDPDADDDDDGMSNLAEYVAGTHPGQGTSVLAFDPIVTNQTATANLIFRWPSVTGRVYAIWRATNAMGPYTQHIGGIAAQLPANSVTNAAPAGLGTYFYGLKVEME
ncbi:MAG TPA: hypothetical protein PLK81_06355, partial [Kiritimatiellia bacterium]|nr:hypothetical protein [Kiritimatiellia bacterium]